MDPSSFTIRFYSHLTEKNWQSFLAATARAGALVEEIDSHTFKLTCFKKNQLHHVGYIVFRTGVPAIGQVSQVSGSASLKASDYENAKLPSARQQ